jgi:hypothetical protein
LDLIETNENEHNKLQRLAQQMTVIKRKAAGENENIEKYYDEIFAKELHKPKADEGSLLHSTIFDPKPVGGRRFSFGSSINPGPRPLASAQSQMTVTGQSGRRIKGRDSKANINGRQLRTTMINEDDDGMEIELDILKETINK